MKMTTTNKLLLASLVFAFACSSNSDPDPGAQNTGGSGACNNCGGGAGEGAPRGGNAGSGNAGSGNATFALAGRIDVKITAPVGTTPGAATFIGKIYEGPEPVKNSWKVAETNGDCELLTPLFPFCDPSCGSSAVCVEDGRCASYPKAVSVGTLNVQGLQTQTPGTIAIETLSSSNLTYQPKASAGLMYPGVLPGEPLIVDATGGMYAPFRVEAKGILPLELTIEENIRVAPDEATHLAWKTSPASTDARILIELDISHHGGIKGQIQCDVDDTGSFDIPAALVTKLIGLGVAGFPSVILTRRSVGSANTALGRVDLVISSTVDRIVDIPGVISCADDRDCPESQTCQQDAKCG
jgi:hypothetical protein